MKSTTALTFGAFVVGGLSARIAWGGAAAVHLITTIIAYQHAGIAAAAATLFLPVLAEGYWFLRLGPLSLYGLTIIAWLAFAVVGAGGLLLSAYLADRRQH